MTHQEARDVTTRIKAGIDDLATLLTQAHDGRAWVVLGYRSWGSYVRAEFGLSRSRSYEVLEQDRVSRALRAAANDTDVPRVSARMAASIKLALPEVTRSIRDRLSADPSEDTSAVVRDAIRETLRSVVPRRRGVLARQGGSNRGIVKDFKGTDLGLKSGVTYDFDSLSRAIDFLAAMPSVEKIWPTLSEDKLQQLDRLPTATRRVQELATMWSAWSGQSPP
jgi:hypothetical protein